MLSLKLGGIEPNGKQLCYWGLATLLEGVGLAFDIQKCSNFMNLNMVV